jgi:arylsulfatase A-like enzyme
MRLVRYTNFEMGARIPLFMRVPGIAPSRTAALVESVDIFPSLAEAASGVILPLCAPGTTGDAPAARLCTEGYSWVATMKAPNNTALQKRAAFSQYARPNNPINGGVPYARGLPPYPTNIPNVQDHSEGVMGCVQHPDCAPAPRSPVILHLHVFFIYVYWEGKVLK